MSRAKLDVAEETTVRGLGRGKADWVLLYTTTIRRVAEITRRLCGPDVLIGGRLLPGKGRSDGLINNNRK